MCNVIFHPNTEFVYACRVAASQGCKVDFSNGRMRMEKSTPALLDKYRNALAKLDDSAALVEKADYPGALDAIRSAKAEITP